jgi:type III pantothenate kinase
MNIVTDAMLLCLDIGNTHILGGVFAKEKLVARFRYATPLIGTADQLGVFLINILKTHSIDPKKISATAMCSVVPSCDYTIKHTISSYLRTPLFVLEAGVKTGLNIKYKTPNEVGADRIANAIGAVNAFPDKNIIIVDMGTATTVCVVTKNRYYLGGCILPGMRLGMESLKNNTAKLMEVDIESCSSYVGRTTKESIQAGLYYGQLGALKEIINGIQEEMFDSETGLVVATGGFAQLYKEKLLFDCILPDLVLQGLCKAYAYSSRS